MQNFIYTLDTNCSFSSLAAKSQKHFLQFSFDCSLLKFYHTKQLQRPPNSSRVMHFVLLCLQCSVTCGSGEQTREVTCVGSGGVKLEDASCSALFRPAAIRSCEMAACPRRISWHVGEWGLVSAANMPKNTGTLCSRCC